MDILYKNHGWSKTAIQYSQCHEFAAESVLRFDGNAARETPAEAVLPKTRPAGIAVRIRIKSLPARPER
jgi:hypothetical protein